MNKPTACPDAGQLRALLQGSLIETEQERLNRHVEACDACQKTLDQLAATSWEERARRLGDAEPASPVLQEIIRDAQSQGTPLETEALVSSAPRPTVLSGQAGADDLSYLAPPAQSGNLGRLDHYEILEIIGKGGFGTVFKARDEKLDRLVAIKVLTPALAGSGTARRRFIREAKAAAALKNDHVIAIHAVDGDGPVPYLVMELISGVSLQDKLDAKGPLEVKEVLRIGNQIACGLAAAHGQGLVHRDIKPANILLENGVERVKITDFGLARAVDDASVTQSGTVAGTPMFMSPEQAEGIAIDHRSDLFSLGTVLYAMCTGHPPFRASGTHAVLKRVIEETPRPIREINPDIPDWLEGIVAKLHAKQPEDRYQTAKEVAEVLGQALAHVQQPAHTAAPVVPQSATGWQVGDRVLAPWEAGWLYVATVEQIKDDSVLVSFCDGHSDWIKAANVRPLDLDKGSRVWAWWSGPYYPGTVTERKGYSVHIAYDDGDEEWTELSYIRVPAGASTSAPPTAPSVVPSEADLQRAGEIFATTLRPGVAVLWQSTWIGLAIGVLLGWGLGFIDRRLLPWDVGAEDVLFGLPVGLLQGAALGAFLGTLVGLARWVLLLRISWEIRNGLRSRDGVRGPLPAMTPAARRFVWTGFGLVFAVSVGIFALVVITKELWRGGRPNSKNVEELEPGWLWLFNGTDLSGWKKDPQHPGNWHVEEGNLVGQGHSSLLFSLRGDYEHFHLRAVAKVDAGASAGLAFRTRFGTTVVENRLEFSGYQVQISGRKGAAVPTGSLLAFGPQTTAKTELVEPGAWFTLEVLALGPRIVIKVNQQTTVDFVDTNADRVTKGHIALVVSDLGGDESIVRFKKIEIHNLPPTGPPPDSDRPLLQGTWIAMNGENRGVPFQPDELKRLKVRFRGDRFHLTMVNGLEAEGPCKLDGASNPKAIDFQFTEPVKGVDPALTGTVRGIYRIDGDRLTLCVAELNEPRPDRFESAKGSKVWVVVMRRAEPAEDEGWVSLFNGKNLDGWKTHTDQPGDWNVKNGLLIGTGGLGYLFTERGDYANFHLRARVKLNAGGDSGILFRSQLGPLISYFGGKAPPGYEAQICHDASQERTGSLYLVQEGEPEHLAREARQRIQPDQWFTLEVIADGPRLTTKVNGEQATSVRNDAFARGHIVLQTWTEETVVHFEKIEIKELPPTSPEVPRKAADVLPFLVGSWKVETQDLDPKLPADKATSVRWLTYDFVANGKILRMRSSPDASNEQLVYLTGYDPGQDTLRLWMARSIGVTEGPVIGTFNPDSRSLTWTNFGAGAVNHQFTFVDPNTIATHMYRVDEKNNVVRLSNLKFTRIKQPSVSPSLPTDPKRPDEMKVLDRLIGEWRSEFTVKDSAKSDKPRAETQRVKSESILGGRFVESHITNETKNTSDYALAWYDVNEKKYRQWFFNGAGDAFEMSGTWNEAAKTLTWTSPDGRLEGRLTFKGDDRHEFVLIVKDGAGKTIFEASSVLGREPGWVQLFNGKDLDGWELPPIAPEAWSVVGKEIVRKPNGIPNVLTTKRRDYGDFHLRAEAKISHEGNGGIRIRVQEGAKQPGFGGLASYEAVINSTDSLAVKTGSLLQHEPGKTNTLVKVPISAVPPDTWFTLDVIAKGPNVTVMVNNVQTAEIKDAEFRSGAISLRSATNTEIRFRNIEIKELPPTKPLAASTPFVILAKDGQPERSFATVNELITASKDEDRLEIRGLANNPANEQVKKLRRELIDLRRLHFNARASRVAVGLMPQLAWPADLISRDKITPEQFAAIGFKEHDKCPPEVVAVLGEPFGPVGMWAHVPYAVFGPDGRRLAIANDHELLIWDLEKQALAHTLKGHTDWVTGAAFSGDGRTIATCSIDQTIKLWDVETGGEGPVLGRHDCPVWCVAFSPDGKTVASGGGGGSNALTSVRLWDVKRREMIAYLKHPQESRVTSVAFSPDGKRLASSFQNDAVKIWEPPGDIELQTKSINRSADSRMPSMPSVAFSPDGKIFASPGKYPTLKLWEADTVREHRTLSDENQAVESACFSPDGTILAGVGKDHVTFWTAQTGADRKTIAVKAGAYVAFAPDSRHLAVARNDGFVVVLRLKGAMAGKGDK
jgi:uncharacterized protein (TIGR03067 family)